jgi:uncharacterized protein YukE
LSTFGFSDLSLFEEVSQQMQKHAQEVTQYHSELLNASQQSLAEWQMAAQQEYTRVQGPWNQAVEDITHQANLAAEALQRIREEYGTAMRQSGQMWQ